MSKFCSNCGAKLKEDDKFCTECGTKIGGTKGKKKTETKVEKKDTKPVSNNKTKTGLIVGICVAAVLVLGLIIGLIVKGVSDHNREVKYKEDVTSFKSDMFKSFQDMESVGNQLSINLYVYTATGTNKYAKYKSPDEAISAALTSKASEAAKVNSEKPGLEKRYNKLKEFDTKDKEELEDIEDALEDVYEEYENVYKAAIKPVGTPTSIMQDYKEARAAFTIKYSALNQLLKKDK